jgi:hypothetical protein
MRRIPSRGATGTRRRLHLKSNVNGRLILHRGRFVADVIRAFEKFQQDVLSDDALADRVLAWLDRHPPLGFWVLQMPSVRIAAESISARGPSHADATVVSVAYKRSPDRPRSEPKTPTIEHKRKNRK